MDEIQFKISLNLFISVIEKKDIESLKIILKNIYYDNNFIYSMLYASKFKISYSNTQLKSILHKEINKIELNRLTKDQKYKAIALALKTNYEDLLKLLIYKDIIIKYEKRYYPLSLICPEKNVDAEVVRLFMEYTDRNNIILDLNTKDEKGVYPLLLASDKANCKIVNGICR